MIAISCMTEPRAADLAHYFAMEKSTVSRNLKGLARLGWVRGAGLQGPRNQGLQLTARGRRKLDQVMPAWKAAQDQAEQLLGPGVAKALDGAAARIRQTER